MAKKVTLDDMTVLRNVTEAPMVVGKENKETAVQRARELLEKVGLVRKPEKLYWKHVKGWAM